MKVLFNCIKTSLCTMEEINLVPAEILYILPTFDGSEPLLDAFITKCDYVVKHFRGKGSEAQDLYLLHCITSKLTGKAAVFASSKSDLNNWEQLKELLIQRFGDIRSEECVASELDSLQIKQDEAFIDFYHRVLAVKSKVLSKINPDLEPDLKRTKELVYEKMALNSLIFNLPEDYARMVRLKGINTLEDVLKVVTEEESFYIEYHNRKRNNQKSSSFGYKPLFPNENNSKYGLPSMPSQGNRFGSFGSSQIPQANSSVCFGKAAVAQGVTQASSHSSTLSQGQAGLFGTSQASVPLSSASPKVDSSSFSFGINLPANPPKILFNNETKTFQNTQN